MTVNSGSQISGFSNVDRASEPRRFITSLDRSAAELREVKQRLTELGGFASCGLWLDLGCGVGHDLDSRSVGVDRSVVLLTEARRRIPRATLVAAEGERLPIRDSVFDGCRIERVLQHVTDATLVLTEMARVLRPGGRVAIFEPDWGSLIFDASDTEVSRAIARSAAGRHRNGRVGRDLDRLLTQVGFCDVRLEPHTVTWRSLKDMHSSFGFGRDVARASAALGRQPRVEAWLKQLERQDREEKLEVRFTRYYATGRLE